MSFCKKIFGLAALIGLLIFSGCELGLGSAVDTLPPDLSIEEPKANDIIYNTFVMSGTWDDELKKIQGITIQLESGNTTYEPVQVPEENLEDFKWFCEIDPVNGNQKYPDGKYNAIVTATDTDGKKTVKSVAFILDNTPPMVILARPATKIDSLSPDGYGCEFDLEGEAVDDNTISLVEVNVFDKETNELKTTVSLENVAKKLERTVAVYGKEDGEYEKIYGKVEDLESILDSKNFYCEVIAYDEARRVPAVEGDKGNCAKFFFLESEVGTYVKDFKSSGFYEIFKSLYNTANEYHFSREVEDNIQDAKDALKNDRILQAAFSLDPRNNPRYTVSSRSNLKELNGNLTSESAKLTNNSTVTVNVLRGLDEYNLVKDSIGISLIECDASGKEIEGAQEIELFAPYKEGDDHEAREKLIKTTGSTYSVDVTIGRKSQPDLVVGKTYVFVVKGHDEKNNIIINYANTDYAFKLASANVVPSLTITELGKKKGDEYIKTSSTANISLANGEKLVIKGDATLEDLVPEVKFVVGLGTDLSANTIGQVTATEFKNGFEWIIPDSYKDTAESTSNFVVRIVAINPEEPEQVNSKEIEVSVDTIKPTFTNISVSPDPVEEGGKQKVNGTITIKGASEDAGTVSKVEYTIVSGGTESEAVTVDKFSSEGFKIKTTDYPDETELTVKLFATDKAGNIGTETLNLFISQKTDLPVIEFTTADPSIKTVAQIKQASEEQRTANIFQINGINNYIGGTVSDDDGIKSITIIKKDNSGKITEEKILENGKSKTYTFKNAVSRIQGEYDIYLKVEDTAGEATGFNFLQTEEFKAAVDEGAPNFVITTTQGLQAQDTELTIGGTVNDGTEVVISRFVYRQATAFAAAKRYFEKANASYTEVDSSEWTELPSDKTYYERVKDPYTDGTYSFEDILVNIGDTTWEDKIPAGEVGSEGDVLYYEATDRYGQTTGQVYIYSIDNQSPKFTITKVNTTLNLSGQVAAGSRENIFVKVTASDPYLTIEGTAEDIDETDPTKSRGLDEFAYYTVIAADSALSEASLTNDAFDISSWKTTKKIENHTWKQTVDLNELNLADGKKYILYVAVKDAAGNVSKVSENPCSAVYIIQDSTMPEFTEPVYKLGDDVIGADDVIQINTSNNDKEISLSVKINDVSLGTPSGIEKVELLENNVSYAYTKTITPTGDNYKVTIKASELVNGTHNLILRATDKVGNYNDFAWKEIGVDVTNPSKPLVTGITPFVTDESDNTVYNGKITIKVSASDETALDKIIWWVTKADGTTKVIDETNIDCVGVTSKNDSIEINTDTKLTQTNGTFKFFIKSLDKGGNESPVESETLVIDQETDQPVITLTNAEVGITTLDGMKTAILNGTTANIFGSSTNNKLNFTVTDDDGIASVIVTDSSKVNPVKVYEYESGTYQKTLKLSYTLPSVKELYDIQIDVTDCKGETTSYKTNSTGTFKVAVDDAEPQITNFTTTIDEKLKDGVLYTNDNFKINFDVSDDYKLGSLVYKENAAAAVNVPLTDGASNEAIEISISKQGTAGATDATKVTNIITLKDTFGRYKEKELTYVFDLKAPVFSDVTHTALSSGYMDPSKTFTVTGKVTDSGTNQSGVNVIKFAVAKGHVNTFPATETAANTFKSWTEVSGSASGWTAKLDAEEITEEGPYTLFVKAIDLAGNETVYGTPVKFIADNKSPVSTISTPAVYFNKGDAGTDVVIEGTITESYLDYSAFAVEVKKNGDVINSDFTTSAPTSSNGNKWSVSIPVIADGTNDGSYEVKASFKDYVHKEVSTSVAKTMIDTKAPVFSNVAYTLLNTSYMDATKTFSVTGKADETGNGKSGVNEIKFAVAKGHVNTYPASEDDVFKSWTEVSGSATGWTARLEANEITTEGNYTLFVKANDLAGNEIVSDPVKFIADKAIPETGTSSITRGTTSAEELEEKSEVYANLKDTEYSESETTKHKFTLSGSVSDSYRMGKVLVTAKKDSTTKTLVNKTVKAGTDTDTNWNWSCDVLLDSTDSAKTNYLENGIWTFTVTAEDAAGKTSDAQTFKVNIDTVNPVMVPVYEMASSMDWRNKSTLKVTPKASDTNGSGLESVSYVIVKAEKTLAELEGTGGNAVSDGEWETITGANKNIATEKTISFENGVNYLYLKAIDKAGNRSFTTVYKARVDTDKPEVVMNNPGAVALVNGKVDIDVSKFDIVVSDQSGLSGVSKVDIYIDSIDADGTNIVASSANSGGLAIDSDGNVTGSIAKAKFSSRSSSFKIIAQVTDTAGNKSNVNTSIGVDVKKPDVTIKTSAKNNIANKDLTIEGTTYDLNGVSSVKLEYLVDSTWIDITDAENGLGLTNLGDTSSWSFVIPTYDAENKSTIAKLKKVPASTVQEIKFRATAVDVAENSKTTDVVTVTIDQDSDRPVVSFVNLSNNGQILQTPTINGNVTDDDNWGAGCVFKIDSVNHTAAEWKSLTQPGQLNIDSNGTFSYTPEDASDGEKQMFFYIKDAAGTEFISASENSNDRPKLKYKGASENSDNDAAVIYTADTASPAIKEVKIGSNAMTVSQVAGGNASAVTIGMVVLDTNGVASAKAVIGSTEYTLTKSETVIAASETFPNLANTNKDEITISAGSKKAVFTSGSIDVSTWTSGQTTVTFEVTDNSGLKSQTTGYFTVDNLGPQVTVRIPADLTEEKTGNVAWSFDFTDYPNTNNAGFSKYSYLVLNDDYFTGTAVDETKILTYMRSHLITIAGGASSVDGLTLTGLPTVAQAEATSKFKKITTIRTDVYSLPVYFYAVDNKGNESLQSFTMIYNLFGGRPSSNVAYPSGTEAEPQAMNGTIRLSGGAAAGTASGAAGVEKVYVQFDVTKGTDFSTADRDYLAGYTISGSENKIYTIHKAANVSVSSNAEINWAGLGGSENFWGIPVTGSNNWYKIINENLEFQNSYNEGNAGVYRVAVRSVALASDGVFGSWSPVQFFDIDTNIPVVNQDPARIVIEGSGTVDYVQDMYVKGNAKLQVAVADKADITKVMVYTAASQGGLNDASQAVITTLDLTDTDVATRQESTWTGLKGYTVNVSLPTPSENKKDIYVKVVAYKANEASAYANYHINFDNTAPSLKKLQFNSVDWLSTDESTHRLVNSNGKFTLGGTASDQESGYDKAAFYFIRGDVTDVSKYRARIYDPMANNKEILVKAKGATSLSLAEKTFGITSAEQGSSAQKMYGAEYTNASVAEVNVTVGGETEKRSQITLASAVNANIKTAGYVLVDGNFYQIDTVDSVTKKITLTENVSSIVGTHDVFFPFMQFVENTGSEKTDEDGLSFTTYPNSDDGDGMPESIIKSQSTWAWDASIQSAFIPDGPGTIVVFVWDKAGNVSAASYACSVQNNAPRLAKLYLGTDLDGSGTYDDEEFKVYDVLGKTGIEQSSYVMNTEDYLRSQFKIKNGLALVTEFTGGNLVTSDDYPSPTIRAMYNKASPDNETKCLKSTADGQADLVSPDASILDAGDLKSAVTAANSNMYAYSFASDEVGEDSTYNSATGEFSSKPMSWTFWDVTSDTTQGVNSSYMYLKVGDFIVDQNDTTPPEMRIKPFYWNSKEDSSVPTDSSEKPLGHIDFAATQTDQTKPGVSGRVYIEGTAHDNTRHGALFMVDPDGTEGQVAEFKDGKWIVGNNTTGTLTYKYMDGTTAIPTAAWTWPSNWKQFEILEAGKPNQEGHDVTWRFTIDMTPYGIGTDKVVTCYGKDAKENTADYNTDARDNTSAADPKPLLNQTNDSVQTSKYVMDFVPYIKGIKGANRSRLGRYPVRAGATIQIEGMNFASSSTYTVNFKKTNGDVASTIANANVTKVSDGVIEVTAPDYSAFLEVVVDGVATQNNENQNTKWNIEEGNWKKGDLNVGENYWTDDRYLSVWNVETSLPGSLNPHSGVVKKINTLNSGRGNPNQMYGGIDAPGGGYFYKQDGQSSAVESVSGQHDQYYASLSSDDLKVYGYLGSKDYTAASRGAFQNHGDNVAFNSSEACFKVPVDTMDCTIVNGLPYYVMQDNFLTGDSADLWGCGLFITREGVWWDRSYLSKDGNTIEEGKNWFIIERHGKAGQKAAARDSTSGYDAVLQQFKNPRIAGWFNAEEDICYYDHKTSKGVDYLYVSYYDSYAHCLKYAAYKIQHRFDGDKIANNSNKQWGQMNQNQGIVPLMHNAITEVNSQYNDNNAVAGNNINTGAAVVAGYDTLRTNPSTFDEDAGEWSDIMIEPVNKYPVIIYYNKTKGCIEIASATSVAPSSGRIIDADGTKHDGADVWNKNEISIPGTSDLGRYVSATMDGAGNIHAVASDGNTRKTYYMYITGSAGNYSLESYSIIDAISSRWTDIELTNPSGTTISDCKPVISYISADGLDTKQGAKVAYFVEMNGTDPVFEAMTDPAEYAVGDQRTSVLADVYEGSLSASPSTKSKIGIGFNSDVYAIDFLRDEQ